ncbi:hypothetical protein GCM10010492_66230 [Saccharothrix mutabilis subsp. mutabilis]|uniref:Uncharacterized protein n=1 Tax=Saccharothrix mutabilis subsp. mutabilis TaxID=66855 RepID=A0ABP3E931_9PSEU
MPEELDDDEGGAAGEPVLQCALFARPRVGEIVELLNASAHSAELLAVWAKTPVGESLADTVFVVTARYEY